jgi:hypothetical protein
MKCSRWVMGEAFNPWHGICGFYPPDVVGRQRGMTDGQKRLYERAVRWAGRNGTFWRGFETIAEALGKSVRQVKSDMAVLERKGLIGHTSRRRSSNVYFFRWHPIFEVQPAALQEQDVEVHDSSLEVQNSVDLKVQSTAHESSPLESCPLNLEKADEKLIPGYASQKQRSAVSPGVTLVHDEPNKNGPNPEGTIVSRKLPTAPGGERDPRPWTKGELSEVRRRITAFGAVSLRRDSRHRSCCGRLGQVRRKSVSCSIRSTPIRSAGPAAAGHQGARIGF